MNATDRRQRDVHRVGAFCDCLRGVAVASLWSHLFGASAAVAARYGCAMKIVQTLFNRGDVEAAGRCFGPAFVDHVEHWDVIDEAGMARRLGIAA